MNWKTTIYTIILSTAFSASMVNAQVVQDVSLYRDIMHVDKVEREYSTRIDATNELKMILTGAFALYKHFVSSQDAAHCAFHPSCSVYAIETIRVNGLTGFLDAIDRLTRCNGMSPEKYKLHEPSQRFHDPVGTHR